MSSKLAAQLEEADTQKEIDKVMSSHEKDMTRILEKLDGQRQRQKDELMRRLAAKRKAQEMTMRNRHKQEASGADWIFARPEFIYF